ncbi:GCN5-related protein N-acetyltransferase [Beutenbergia cavernae DSM 12333]|uniref:GCN5-related protein N-acetyltransferase n=1 Tax=Beutenbergia cavernae (strain ATCC BAA-8 / DSM 12333 / CCUG 43141 / JCM 11478 / NBRC 16432 / NCIMB 13614 / HKI 0122) TaxID=471853 RepID=C5C4T1_BEUC1|nr:GNAT family N-acetyltransferase [Beutenbergia cavernae]ACQ80059.1 GCN5-related protein N-acetyltransferase [Beutenbergia cavernae DSM 12333]
MPELILPHVRLYGSFVEAMTEFAAEGRGGADDDSTIGHELRTPPWGTHAGFVEYVESLLAASDEATPRPDGYVPDTTLWWVDGDVYLGRIAVRHRLTPALRVRGGHIGYDVRPSRRRAGHATAMLAAVLPIANDLGIDPALLTCDEGNVASRTVIERAGGRLIDTGAGVRRYWVPTAR